MTDEHDDDKVIGYLHTRAQVRVPDDSLERSTTRAIGARAGRPPSAAVRGLSLAAAAVLVAVVVVLVASLPANVPVASTHPSNAAAVPPGSGQTASPSQSPLTVVSPGVGAPFPSSVLGMPVITVAEAGSLAAAGQLNGRDVAVGGWFFEEFPPCPEPLGGYFSALDDYCIIAAFADTQDAAKACQSGACQLGHTPMAPWLMNDTLGELNDYSNPLDATPVPIVVIGHTGDPRAWHCLPDNLYECSGEFVADRLAWANGADLGPSSEALDHNDFIQLSTKRTVAGIAALLGDGNQLLSAAATTADDVRSFDPRWNMTGSSVLWIVRSIAKPGGDGADPTSAVTVSLIDDTSGQVVDSDSLALPADYNPARLWVTVTIHHSSDANYGNSISAFDRIVGEASAAVDDGEISGGEGSSPTLTILGPDLPLVIDAGTYSLDAWLAPRDSGPEPTPLGECSTQETLGAGDDVMLSAIYDKSGDCAWSNQEEPSFGFPFE